MSKTTSTINFYAFCGGKIDVFWNLADVNDLTNSKCTANP